MPALSIPAPAPLLFVCGPSGAGKSTLSEAIRAEGWAHFDGDRFGFGCKDCTLPGIPDFEGLQKEWMQISERHAAILGVPQDRSRFFNAYHELFVGQRPQWFDEFYAVMCQEIAEARKRTPGPMVVSQAVYFEEHRDLIRRMLPDVRFIVLDAPNELLKVRLGARDMAEGNVRAKAMWAAEHDPHGELGLVEEMDKDPKWSWFEAVDYWYANSVKYFEVNLDEPSTLTIPVKSTSSKESWLAAALAFAEAGEVVATQV